MTLSTIENEQFKLERAIMLATEAHFGQTRKDGTPYILHPLRMMLAAKTHDQQIVALLHDVLEDADPFWQSQVPMITTAEQHSALRILCHRQEVPYVDYIRSIGPWELARSVKILDLKDNLLVPWPGLKREYRAALAYLEAL